VVVLGRRVVLQMWVGSVWPREAFPDHGSGGCERGSSLQGNREGETTLEFRLRRQSRSGEHGPRRAPIDGRHPRSGEPGSCHEDLEEAGLGLLGILFESATRRENLAGDRGVRGPIVPGVSAGRTMPTDLPYGPPKRMRWREPPGPSSLTWG